MAMILDSLQMKLAEQATIQECGMSSMVLMERAALSVVDELMQKPERLQRVLVLCGPGNNGGDGIAVARLLHLRGIAVDVFCTVLPEQMSAEQAQQYHIAQAYQTSFVSVTEYSNYTLLIDALFGIGLSRDIGDTYRQLIEDMNESGVYCVSLDIPSGIESSTGQVLHTAVRASATITFAYAKAGLYLYPGAFHTGKITIKDVGIYWNPNEHRKSETASPVHPPIYRLTAEDLGQLPARRPDGHKGTFGKILCIAGSRNMAGAAYLSALACLRTGAGMVKIHTEECNRQILQTRFPEALLSTYDHDAPLRKAPDFSWCDAVVIGPGLGVTEASKELLEFTLRNCTKPMVLDADALHLLSVHPMLKQYLSPNCVITPHLLEMQRFSGVSLALQKSNLVDVARQTAREYGITCVLKDARTVTADAKGNVCLTITGNDGMATAGAGDVLSGVIAGLMAQGMPPSQAAVYGVYLHSLAGDAAYKSLGRTLLADDIIDHIKFVFKEADE
ncbi:MAG: NAD(P)H-hydrate dehydratase [Lachnospiraceae bacterium]